MSLDPNIIKMMTEYKNIHLPEVDRLREILQQCALLGLARQNFFEHAAFYGGTALRILYGLDRFSEDLDFTLLRPEKEFNFSPYLEGLCSELRSFGFEVDITIKEKKHQTPILSAFLKTNTLNLLLSVHGHYKRPDLHPEQKIRIKLEIDTDPPSGFRTDTKAVLSPIPFNVVTLEASDLFAGKMHAALYRGWKQRVKGRDWYDLIWFLREQIPLNLKQLARLMEQAGNLEPNVILDEVRLHELLEARIDKINWTRAKEDVAPFISRVDQLELWSADFFKKIIKQQLRVK